MKFRIVALAAILLLAAATLATPAQPVDSPAGHAPTLLIYLAKGAPDACGRGCDRWIAIEGNVDKAAADRVEQFLRGVLDNRLPIYFHSPGGEGSQAFAIARMLRARKATARVGRTVAVACPGTQADDACVMIKTTHRELSASIVHQVAMCNSACGLMFFGATTREVGPDASFGVHNSKLVIAFKRFVSDRERERAMTEARDSSNRELKQFIEAMGIGRELFDLIETISYENKHYLTREELYRFHIDRRNFVETPWAVGMDATPFLRKAAFVRRDDRFFNVEWRLSCVGTDRVRVLYARDIRGEGFAASAVILAAAGQPPRYLFRLPQRSSAAEIWGTAITTDDLKKLAAASSLTVGESTTAPGGGDRQDLFEIDTVGLEAGWRRVADACAGKAPLALRASPPDQRKPSAPPVLPFPSPNAGAWPPPAP